jgi:hypothetical protein
MFRKIAFVTKGERAEKVAKFTLDYMDYASENFNRNPNKPPHHLLQIPITIHKEIPDDHFDILVVFSDVAVDLPEQWNHFNILICTNEMALDSKGFDSIWTPAYVHRDFIHENIACFFLNALIKGMGAFDFDDLANNLCSIMYTSTGSGYMENGRITHHTSIYNHYDELENPVPFCSAIITMISNIEANIENYQTIINSVNTDLNEDVNIWWKVFHDYSQKPCVIHIALTTDTTPIKNKYERAGVTVEEFDKQEMIRLINGHPMSYGDIGSREMLLARDGWKCFYCGQEFSVSMDGYNNMTVDHKISRAKDGKDELSNLIIACRNCNSAKNDSEIHNDNESLKQFCIRRKKLRLRDEEWVKQQYEFAVCSFGNSKPQAILEEDEIIEDLLSFLEPHFQKVKLVKPNNNPSYIDFFDGDNEWTFELRRFLLQPFFIHKADFDGKTIIPEAVEIKLEELFYFKGGTEYRSKYIKPFSNSWKGLNILMNEIELVKEIWKL